jgi:hypothetical protein
MTKDDIIRMAREAGCLGPGEGGDPNGLWEPNGWENVTELMFRFADLIAAAERERLAQPRQWQGLTGEEVGALTVFDGLHHVEVPVLADFIRAIEAKIKENNQ